MLKKYLSWIIFGVVAIAILTLGLLFGGSSVDLAEVFDAEVAECTLNIKQQDEGVTTDIVLSGTLTAIKDVDVESLTVEGFATIGESEPESMGKAELRDRLFRPGDTWDFMLTAPNPGGDFTLSGCSVDINANIR